MSKTTREDILDVAERRFSERREHPIVRGTGIQFFNAFLCDFVGNFQSQIGSLDRQRDR